MDFVCEYVDVGCFGTKRPNILVSAVDSFSGAKRRKWLELQMNS